MHICSKCGHQDRDEDKIKDKFASAMEMDDDEDMDLHAKRDVLAELSELLRGSLGDKLPQHKPKAAMVELTEFDDEEEDA